MLITCSFGVQRGKLVQRHCQPCGTARLQQPHRDRQRLIDTSGIIAAEERCCGQVRELTRQQPRPSHDADAWRVSSVLCCAIHASNSMQSGEKFRKLGLGRTMAGYGVFGSLTTDGDIRWFAETEKRQWKSRIECSLHLMHSHALMQHDDRHFAALRRQW